MKTLAIENINQKFIRIGKPSSKNKIKRDEYESISFLGAFSLAYKTYEKTKNFDTQVLEFYNCFFIITHGHKDGSLDNVEIIKTIILTNEKPVFIFCCYPKMVSEKYPELKDNFISTEIETPVYCGYCGDNFTVCFPDLEENLFTGKVEIDEIMNPKFLKICGG